MVNSPVKRGWERVTKLSRKMCVGMDVACKSTTIHHWVVITSKYKCIDTCAKTVTKINVSKRTHVAKYHKNVWQTNGHEINVSKRTRVAKYHKNVWQTNGHEISVSKKTPCDKRHKTTMCQTWHELKSEMVLTWSLMGWNGWSRPSTFHHYTSEQECCLKVMLVQGSE